LDSNNAATKDADQLAKDLENKASIGSGDQQEGIRGVPDFWLTIFRNVPLLSESKEDCDDPILSSLCDIQCHISAGDARPGFCLEFHFAPNDYFTDSMLRKDYFVRFEPSTIDPLGFEGPEIIEAKGCTISWKPGRNVTVRTVKKIMKHKNRGEKKTISKTVKTNSFFRFFDPPKGCIDNLDLEDEDEEVNRYNKGICQGTVCLSSLFPSQDVDSDLQADFELGQYIREQVIPRAILLYTGEGVEDEDDYDSEGEGEEEEDEDDDDEQHASGRGGGHRQRGNSQNQQECKQQ
jgi:nucleosome assembly protein 1-like 1